MESAAAAAAASIHLQAGPWHMGVCVREETEETDELDREMKTRKCKFL